MVVTFAAMLVILVRIWGRGPDPPTTQPEIAPILSDPYGWLGMGYRSGTT